MRFKLFSLAILITLAPQLFAAGWINLFNGQNLDGWTQRTGNAKYYVTDGCIVGQMIAPGNGTNSFLCTTKEYDNFILEFDVKADPRMNTGVQFRSAFATNTVSFESNGTNKTVPPGYVFGYQVEVDTDLKGKTWTGGIYDEHRRRNYLTPSGGQTNAEGKAFTELNRQITKTNDWNHIRLEVVGDHFKTYLNGVLRADIHDSMSAKGFFGLQVHNSKDASDNGALVFYKNIRLQKVSPKSPVAEPTLNTLTEKEIADGWKLLWDGKTTDGWRSPKSDEFPPEGWEIKNGELWVTNNNGAEAQHGGDIITRNVYSNFEMTAEFKATPGCNSGIKIFVQPNISPIDKVTGKPTAVGSAIGLEYQILDDARHPDAKLGVNGDRTLGSLYDLMPASKNKKPNFIGDWNTARIVSRGNHVDYYLNGDKILSFTRGSKTFRQAVAASKFKDIPNFGEWPDGHILLQEHGSEAAFRNIKIRELN